LQASSLAKDGIDIVMIYCNKKEEDILCRDMLEGFAESNKEHFKLYFTLTRLDEKGEETWKGLRGRIC